MNNYLVLIQTALELGLISGLVVLALFLSYSILNVCDLSTDGCFTLGAAVGATVALSGHPLLSIPAAMGAGVMSGFVTGFLQTYMGVNSLLAGIAVNTGLYSVNIAIMGNSSLINLNKADTVFTMVKSALADTPFAQYNKTVIAIIAVVLVACFIGLLLKTRLGMAMHATGSNPDMVTTSSINPQLMTVIGLCISNSFTALSGCLLAQSQKGANIDIGTGMVTIALASLLIGSVLVKSKTNIPLRLFGAVMGAFAFRLVYTIALRLHMPAYMLKLVSSTIVIRAISGPYLKDKFVISQKRKGGV